MMLSSIFLLSWLPLNMRDGPYLSGLWEALGYCEPDVVVTGASWEDVHIGNGNSLRFFSNGRTGYYQNGEYRYDVQRF